MGIEALWSMRFGAEVEGSGVVVLETERIFGGDARYYYLGEYKVEGKTISAIVKVQHYHGEPRSIFGYQKRFTVHSRCEIKEDGTIQCYGQMQDCLDGQMAVVLTRLADLPNPN